MRVIFGWGESGKSTLIEALVQSEKNLVVVRDDGRSDLISSLEAAVGKSVASKPEPASPKEIVPKEIVIEADAVLEPIAVAELFYLEGEHGEPPDDRFEIYTVATIIDARSFLADLQTPVSLVELGLGFDEIDDRTKADVLIEQIEFSDIVVLNRVSELDANVLSRTKSAIEWLNPRALLLQVPLEGIGREFVEDFWRCAKSNQFDFDESSEGAGWIQALANSHPRKDVGQGLSVMTFRARRPVHPERFKQFIESLKAVQVLRIKGWVWIATRNAEMGLWSMAGGSSVLVSAGAWMAATPMGEWPEDPEDRAEIMEEWIPPYGDRRQEFAMMGFDFNELELRRSFKNCLLTDAEFEQGPEQWSRWTDSLPDWSVDAGDDFDGLLQ